MSGIQAVEDPTLPMPRLELARVPTRVHRLNALSRAMNREVWVKRDDESSTSYGGNKVRKLEFLLAEAKRRGATDVWTIGAYGSHHAFATAWYARQNGLNPHALLFPQPASLKAAATLRATSSLADVHPLPPWHAGLADEVRAYARLAFSRRSVWIPAGGSSAAGTMGFVRAAFELGEQIRRGECPRPLSVFVPFGTGGTAVGLALGFSLQGLDIEVVAVRVVPKPVAMRAELVALALRALARVDNGSAFRRISTVYKSLANIRMENHFLGSGYAHPTPASRAAIDTAAEESLALDPTYTGKAFAALLATNRPGALLFWNTYGDSLPAVPMSAHFPPWVESFRVT